MGRPENSPAFYKVRAAGNSAATHGPSPLRVRLLRNAVPSISHEGLRAFLGALRGPWATSPRIGMSCLAPEEMAWAGGTPDHAISADSAGRLGTDLNEIVLRQPLEPPRPCGIRGLGSPPLPRPSGRVSRGGNADQHVVLAGYCTWTAIVEREFKRPSAPVFPDDGAHL